MQSTKNTAPWKLKGPDFSKKKVHAAQDWRFQMLFEYLRISPSYALAHTLKNEVALAEALGDAAWAARVWKTYTDIGNVHEVLYRDWWLRNGLKLFGVHTAKPKSEKITRLSHEASDAVLSEQSVQSITAYLNGNFKQQGAPDSVLVSIPLGQKRMTIMRQLRKLLDEANLEPIYQPQATYMLENNKMRYRRLLAGLRLVYMRSARPNDALWRIATRAKISTTHNTLDPLAQRKEAKTADARRMLTIMASRLLHDVLVMSENAAQGIFPSLQATSVISFDYETLANRIKQNNQWEKTRKAELLASN